MKYFKFYIALIIVLAPLLAKSQQTRATFGKNRLQFDEFNWRFYSTENFDIYFYGKSDKIALEAVGHLEEEFDRITEVVGYSPYFKAKVFIYNSINDLQQSNIGVSGKSHRVGGQTDFVKSYVEVANPGSVTKFKENLSVELSKLVLSDMMFGGSLSDMWQNTYLMNLPPWFVNGASEYMAKGWSIDMDDKMRDLILSDRVKKLNSLTGEESKVAGQSMWNFIVEKYGRSNLNQILNLVRVTRNEEKSISFTLGLPFRQVMLEWEQFYANQAGEVAKSYVLPGEENMIVRSKDDDEITSVALSPDGTKLVYAINEMGKYEVILRDLTRGSEKKILKGGFKMVNQVIDHKVPYLNWSDDNTLGIIGYHRGNNVLWLYDLTSDSFIRSPLRNFDRVNDFDFSGNGRLAVLSATRNGKTDLFLLSVRRNKIRRLTDDVFDDINPRFIPGTNSIVFSSNRVSDTLNAPDLPYKELSENFNIFAFNLDTTRNELARITNTISRDFSPIAADANTFYYLSDQKGVVNLFKYNIQDSIYAQVTNFATNIRKLDLNFEVKSGAYSMINGLDEALFYHTNVNFDQNVFTPATPRQTVMQAKFISSRRLNRASQQRSQRVNLDLKPANPTPIAQPVDSVSLEEEVKNEKVETGIIDTDDYVFDKEVTKKAEESESFLSSYRRVAREEKPRGPFPYETRFSANSMVTSWVIDPFRRFGILLETEMNDMLENHKFNGGVMTTLDLKSGDVFAEYRYLKGLVDYNLRYDRSVWYVNETEQLRQRYSKNRFEVGASLPLTARSRVSLKPFYLFTRYQDLNFLNLLPNTSKADANATNYLGISTEYVFDNSVVPAQNVIVGSRMKLQFSYHEALNDRSRSFGNVNLDLRHYQKIYRNVVFAGRLFYGKFFGRFNHQYMIGGMDNWLFQSSPDSPSPWRPEVSLENNNIYFMQYVTSLRGYNYNALNGTDALLVNLELRIPIVNLLYNGPVRSSFAKNLQFVGFFDIGSSWTGASPFSENNSISTVTTGDRIFEAEIQTFKNPWLSGYGIGMRTVVLGYFMKFDLAWPLEDFEVGDAKFYFTLGHDF